VPFSIRRGAFVVIAFASAARTSSIPKVATSSSGGSRGSVALNL